MNILLVTDTYLPYITGVSVSTDSIANFMISQGHRVTIVCPKAIVKGKLPVTYNLTVVNTPSIPFAIVNKNPIGIFPTAIPIIEDLVRKQYFDIVHIQEPMPTGISALIVAKKHKIPTVGAFHFIPQQTDRNIFGGKVEGILTLILNKYINYIYNKYDSVMTVSHFFANYLKHQGVKKEVYVVSNGVDTEVFKPGSVNITLRHKLGIPDKNIVFMFLGRIDGDKNVETLVKAMRYTSENITLLIIGRGRKKQQLQILAKWHRVSKKIIWVNYISNEEMPDYYHCADVFTIMSPYEGQSIVTLQAVATGLPIIAANASALPELVKEGKSGFLVASYDHKMLGEKMNILAKDKILRKSFGKEGRQISLKHNKKDVLKVLEELYKKLISAN